jgi:signal transduction histidine kinase
MLVLIISMLYTSYLATKLKEGEQKSVELYVKALEDLANSTDMESDISLSSQLTMDIKIPTILTDQHDNIIDSKNFGINYDQDSLYIKKQLAKIKQDGYPPIVVNNPLVKQKVYYKNSLVYNMLTYFPYVQILLLSIFIAIGYLGLSAARKNEQNRLWVGMAKETAHQLGTPISAIIAWIEHLKTYTEGKDKESEILTELRNDVTKLELVVDRFSKIGSVPVLSPYNIYTLLENVKVYMSKRSPRKIIYVFPDPAENKSIQVKVNKDLFSWVMENLIRNALDAMEGNGMISCEVYSSDQYVFIDLADTGKGMTSKQAKNAFNPGFTTKSRGWGLGLSLGRRIIDDYHGGRIFIKKTMPGKGTVFTIQLPQVEAG